MFRVTLLKVLVIVLGAGVLFPGFLLSNRPAYAFHAAPNHHTSIIRDFDRFDHSQNRQFAEQKNNRCDDRRIALLGSGLNRWLISEQQRRTVGLTAVSIQEEGKPEEAETPAQTAESDEEPVISAEQVKLKTVINEEAWVGMSEQELNQVIQVSGKLKWKGLYRWGSDFRPQPANFELVLGARGAKWLDSVFNIGFVEIDSFLDKAGMEHQPSRIPPGIENPLEAWVFPELGKDASEGTDSGQALFVNLEFPRPEQIPFEATSVKGSLKLNLATEYDVITIDNIAQTKGRLELPELAKMGLEITISRPGDLTIMVAISGDTKRVADVKVVGETGDVGETKLVIPNKAYFQIDFISEISEELGLKIRLVKASRELTLPFEMEGMFLRAER